MWAALPANVFAGRACSSADSELDKFVRYSRSSATARLSDANRSWLVAASGGGGDEFRTSSIGPGARTSHGAGLSADPAMLTLYTRAKKLARAAECLIYSLTPGGKTIPNQRSSRVYAALCVSKMSKRQQCEKSRPAKRRRFCQPVPDDHHTQYGSARCAKIFPSPKLFCGKGMASVPAQSALARLLTPSPRET